MEQKVCAGHRGGCFIDFRVDSQQTSEMGHRGLGTSAESLFMSQSFMIWASPRKEGGRQGFLRSKW